MRKFLLNLCILGLALTATAQNLKVTTDAKGRVGYSDENGNLLIPCKYTSGQDFANGIALVSKGNLYGYIDQTGQEVLPIKCTEVGEFDSGIARIKMGNLWGFIDEKAQIVMKPTYSFIGEYNEYGKALVNKGGRLDGNGHIAGGTFGVIDRTGKELIPCKYKVLMEYGSKHWDWSKDENEFNKTLEVLGNTASFVEYTENYTLETDCSLMAFSSNPRNRNNLAGLVDGNGTEIVKEGIYNRLCKPFEGKMQFYKLTGTTMTQGFYDLATNQEIVVKAGSVPKTYKNGGWDCFADSTYVCRFYGKLAPVVIGATSKAYFVDQTGVKVSPVYRSVVAEERENNPGVFVCYDGTSSTMYDFSGTTIIEGGQYEQIGLFDNKDDSRLFPARKYGKYGAIDENNNVVIPFEYDDISRSTYGKFYVCNDGKWGLIDANNIALIPVEFDNISIGEDSAFEKCWVQTTDDNLWRIYDIKQNAVMKHGYEATGGFADNVAIVKPVADEITSLTQEAGTPFYPIDFLGDKSEELFVVVDTEGNMIMSTPVPYTESIVKDVKEIIKKNHNQPLTKAQEKSFVLRHNAGLRFNKIESVISELQWDF